MNRVQQAKLIEQMSQDSVFGCQTRQALEMQYGQIWYKLGGVLFLDIDKMHNLNETYGYSEIDRRIKECLSSLRQSDVKAFRWYSGDELVIFIFDGDIEKMGIRLKSEFEKYGIGISYTTSNIILESLEDTVKPLSNAVQKMKLDRYNLIQHIILKVVRFLQSFL